MTQDDRVLQYAPLLRFSRQETHFPIDPTLFVSRSRLRRLGWSSTAADGYWNPRVVGWDSAGPAESPPTHAVNPDLNRACALMQVESPSQPGARRNRRPNDPANLWGGRRAGYTLELTQAFARELRGVAGSAPFLMYDRYRIELDGGRYDVITYWFFYAIHPHVTAHEGDWEPVSVLVPAEGGGPVRLCCSARADGPAVALSAVEVVDETHPVVHVEPGSHRSACDASTVDGGPGAILLRTWRLTLRPIQDMPWSCYDGAWGRVGATDQTTGPLGPLFRRAEEAIPAVAVRAAMAG